MGEKLLETGGEGRSHPWMAANPRTTNRWLLNLNKAARPKGGVTLTGSNKASTDKSCTLHRKGARAKYLSTTEVQRRSEKEEHKLIYNLQATGQTG